ncbi:MAG TPA: hypothetical protein VIQ31_34665, partial [Phormidium sp.]
GSTRLRQHRDELNQEFHLIKLFRHADSYSYLLLNYSKRLIGNKFPPILFPQAGPSHSASRLPYYFCEARALLPDSAADEYTTRPIELF